MLRFYDYTIAHSIMEAMFKQEFVRFVYFIYIHAYESFILRKALRSCDIDVKLICIFHSHTAAYYSRFSIIVVGFFKTELFKQTDQFVRFRSKNRWIKTCTFSYSCLSFLPHGFCMSQGQRPS